MKSFDIDRSGEPIIKSDEFGQCFDQISEHLRFDPLCFRDANQHALFNRTGKYVSVYSLSISITENGVDGRYLLRLFVPGISYDMYTEEHSTPYSELPHGTRFLISSQVSGERGGKIAYWFEVTEGGLIDVSNEITAENINHAISGLRIIKSHFNEV